MQIEPGKQYQMRNGECATVLVKNPVACSPLKYWIGVFSNGCEFTWRENGRRDPFRESPFDLITPWPAPVVRDLAVNETGMSFCGTLGHRFRLTWNPAQPDVLEWEVVK